MDDHTLLIVNTVLLIVLLLMSFVPWRPWR
jgi:hypothetical protein